METRARKCAIRQIRKDVHAALVERGPLRSDAHASRSALEQSRTQVLLKALHQVAHRRLRHLQRIACFREPAQFDHAGERLQGHQSIHCPHSRTVIPLYAGLSLSCDQ